MRHKIYTGGAVGSTDSATQSYIRGPIYLSQTEPTPRAPLCGAKKKMQRKLLYSGENELKIQNMNSGN